MPRVGTPAQARRGGPDRVQGSEVKGTIAFGRAVAIAMADSYELALQAEEEEIALSLVRTLHEEVKGVNPEIIGEYIVGTVLQRRRLRKEARAAA